MAHSMCRTAVLIGLFALFALEDASEVQREGRAPPDLREEDLTIFKSHGQVLTRGTLEKGEVEQLARRLRVLLLEHGRSAFGDEKGQKEVRFTFAVHELDPFVANFVGSRGSQLWRAAQKLAGSQELCLLMDRGFSKDPGDPETHWHRDDEAIGLPARHPSLRTVHAWIPLEGMDRGMGTLQYVVGTHRRSYGLLEKLLASLWGWEFAWFITSPIVQDDAMELGDVAWHDGWVLHSAGANTAARVRDGLAVSFAYCSGPSDCDGAAARTSHRNATCRIAASLFDERWRAQHRSGENDYAKTLIEEPVRDQAARFVLRSLVGGLAGMGLHKLLANRCRARQKPP